MLHHQLLLYSNDNYEKLTTEKVKTFEVLTVCQQTYLQPLDTISETMKVVNISPHYAGFKLQATQ